ncbi:MAG TPA: phosphoribosylamine--glycine ligase [Geminicoccus sp.]|jgi:phosphoribosylamine--glycine ligase|uniref:phosphoribosylamine--glycine ligase n=1 Tax=Geminicoccus sp. TaxID=2024832 RepID=UPI002E3481C7|nr:phosphoribosylamine--glycine ligase [Geminicoccus sp.]HEX2525512.1 phosphoribosylamine--glycine ligase [Geminicoccus sp.]
MKTLVIGSGGREHALCWSLAASPLVSEVLCAPGNAGIANVARCVPVPVDDVEGLLRLALDEGVGLVVVGPELPLTLGLVDRLSEAGVRAFGPSAAAARLESSKAFTKDFCTRHGIPTARYRTFTRGQEEDARTYVRAEGAPIVVKADGLAAGKGVVVAGTIEEALAAVDDAFSGGFGEAGATLVIEECLQGEEASLFALCDGTHALEIGTAQDHKRAFDGDAGPNTGGMGAYSPAPILTPELVERVMQEIIRPTLGGMAAEGQPFKGFLYAGLMLTADGPKLIEYNVRFGDPECQVVLPRLMTDLCQLILGAIDGQLGHMNLRWFDAHALSVVLAAKGYPGPYRKGTEIRGTAGLEGDDLLLFHAGTVSDGERLLANGGRVLNVTGLGASLQEARDRAYQAVDRIDWPDGFCRRDIGWRALAAAHS